MREAANRYNIYEAKAEKATAKELSLNPKRVA